MKTAWVNRYIFFIAVLIGSGIFLLLYGVDAANPFNTAWLFSGGDLTQHYVGWQFFQQSAWTFPIGVAQGLAYPHGLAITFTDSIPFMAIPAKLLTAFVEQPVQYFGLWGLLSFGLTAAITSLIVRRWTTNTLVLLVVPLLPLLMPIMLNRMFSHTALAGQWVLLLGIWILVSMRNAGLKRFVLWWSLCLSLSVMIHPYFVVMNAFLLTLSVIWSYKTALQVVLRAVAPLVAALVVTWVIGGLSVKSVGANDLGRYGYDIGSFVNSDGWSFLLHDFSFVNGGGGESFGYPGLGAILLVLTALGIVVARFRQVVNYVRLHWVQFLAMLFVTIVLLLVAIGPNVYMFGSHAFSYALPELIEKLWSVVRATARMMWPMYYLVLFLSLYIVIRFLGARKYFALPIVIVVIVILQGIDVTLSPSVAVRTMVPRQAAAAQYQSTLTDPRWKEVVKDIKHVVYLEQGLYRENFRDLAELCIEHDMTLNNGYFARSPAAAIQQTIDEAQKEVEQGTLRSDTLYIHKNTTELKTSSAIQGVYELNELVVLRKTSI